MHQLHLERFASRHGGWISCGCHVDAQSSLMHSQSFRPLHVAKPELLSKSRHSMRRMHQVERAVSDTCVPIHGFCWLHALAEDEASGLCWWRMEVKPCLLNIHKYGCLSGFCACHDMHALACLPVCCHGAYTLMLVIPWMLHVL